MLGRVAQGAFDPGRIGLHRLAYPFDLFFGCRSGCRNRGFLDGQEFHIDAAILLAVFGGVIREARIELALAADIHLVGGNAAADQIRFGIGGAAFGQGLVVGLRSHRIGMANHADPADAGCGIELGNEFIEGSYRVRTQVIAVEIEEGIAIKAGFVAYHLRFARRGAVGVTGRGAHFNHAERFACAEVLAELVTQQQPAARIRLVDLEIAGFAGVFTLQSETERTVAEQLVDAERDRRLAGIEITAFVVEAAAHAQQGIIEITTKAQADTVLVGVFKGADQGVDGLGLGVGAVGIGAGQGGGVAGQGGVDQAGARGGVAEIAAEEQVIALPADADARLAILEGVLVGGGEHLPHAGLVRIGCAAQEVVAELHATGASLAQPDLAQPGRIVVLAEDGEDFAEDIAVVIDAERNARIGADPGQWNRGIVGGGFCR